MPLSVVRADGHLSFACGHTSLRERRPREKMRRHVCVCALSSCACGSTTDEELERRLAAYKATKQDATTAAVQVTPSDVMVVPKGKSSYY